MFDLALITCTADQPTGFALCEHFMQRQTVRGQLQIQWVVVDDGKEPARCTLGQTYIRRSREKSCSPAQSLCRNLTLGLNHANAERYAIIEHDDFYGPTHLEDLIVGLVGVDVCGAGSRCYYNVARRCYKHVRDGAPALCQMGLTPRKKSLLLDVTRAMDRRNWWGIDAAFWRRVLMKERRELVRGSVVGIKGLPGKPGIGYGHRPPKSWRRDPDGTKLRELVGVYADLYLAL